MKVFLSSWKKVKSLNESLHGGIERSGGGLSCMTSLDSGCGGEEAFAAGILSECKHFQTFWSHEMDLLEMAACPVQKFIQETIWKAREDHGERYSLLALSEPTGSKAVAPGGAFRNLSM